MYFCVNPASKWRIFAKKDASDKVEHRSMCRIFSFHPRIFHEIARGETFPSPPYPRLACGATNIRGESKKTKKKELTFFFQETNLWWYRIQSLFSFFLMYFSRRPVAAEVLGQKFGEGSGEGVGTFPTSNRSKYTVKNADLCVKMRSKISNP